MVRDSFVVLVAHPSADLYGSDRVLLESVEGLVAHGLKVIVTIPSSGPLVPELISRGATVLFCPSPVLRKSMLSLPGLVQAVPGAITGAIASLRLLASVRPDVVYVNTVTIPLWNLVAVIKRVPLLVHVHEAEGSANGVVRRLLAFPLLAAGCIVANSQFSSRVLQSSFALLGDRTAVVYNGVPGPEVVRAPRERLDSPFRILFLGRLSARKGVDVVVDALATLRKRGISAHLDIVGAVFPGYEWYETELRALVHSHDLAPFVNVHGFQSSVWPFLDAADAVVIPSRLDEPFGNTAVEALLAARPVVVSDTSGLREAAGGYSSVQFVVPGNPESAANALEYIVANWDQYRQASMADAPLAATRHSITTYQAAMAERVQRVAGRV
jgi:glycosyltransferase involved in cell wall biosynthesis